ncbi:M28 family metallopeptidase [Sphingorhabdus sp. M41]|uniref:M28 family metallopeptidase n=1 Tax=Sphingorhabdus sp. M41 TaxID=1806885 RepID=UPI00078B3188|nr:M28 family metallopeptidase [Sphingorhabdus sp. M41]AMO73342.1 peptidase M20 [Sphingorhabdus sp. M41]
MVGAPAHAKSADQAIDISADEISRTVRTLTLDQFEGRAPGTAGEDRTIGYLISRFEALGLEPGGVDGTWTQPVPLLHTALGKPETLSFSSNGKSTALNAGKDIYVSTLQPKDRAVVDNAEMVFVGFGVTAPERGWDDFKNVDLKGKVAVFLVNDPDFAATADEPVAGKFGGRAMTYYGRWTYKFEEASRRGAVAALIIHETEAAGYGWSVVESPQGENYGIAKPAGDMTSLALQGWISGDTAQKLFDEAGLDLAKLRMAARTREFTPVAIGAKFAAAYPVTQEVVKSQNIFGKISGKTRPEETIIYGAHWDAYGEGPPDEDGKIYRAGANDDALGIAGIMEIARKFKAKPQPDRTIVIAAWTAEERGLLGSEVYAQDPIYPVETTVANLAIDVLQTAGKAKDVILVGKGQGTLEDDLAKFAKLQGRVVTEESLPERGLFFRADHFSLAKRGVPVLLMMSLAGASDLVDGGRAAGQKWINDYTGNCYHAACDAWTADWDLTGALQDINVMFDIGNSLAYSRQWPEWKDGSEFKELRDASAEARQ